MLTLEFSVPDIARTRFAISPLWEVVTSVQALKEPRRHFLHDSWGRATRGRLEHEGVEIPLLSALIPIPSYYIPVFLTPVPASAAPDLETELGELLATAPAVVRADIEQLDAPWPVPVTALHRDPAAGLEQLVGEIRAYWTVALQPYWGRIRQLLDGEVLHRARALAQGGADQLFQDLHPQITWDGSTLRVAHPFYEATRTLDAGRGLVLVPSAFAWPGVFSQTSPPRQPGLIYPPRAVGGLWDTGAPVSSALAGVVGKTRARLLAGTAVPASTAELARRLDLSNANVSHHLGALRDAGLVTSYRDGHSVCYLRTAVAEALIATSVPDGGRDDGRDQS